MMEGSCMSMFFFSFYLHELLLFSFPGADGIFNRPDLLQDGLGLVLLVAVRSARQLVVDSERKQNSECDRTTNICQVKISLLQIRLPICIWLYRPLWRRPQRALGVKLNRTWRIPAALTSLLKHQVKQKTSWTELLKYWLNWLTKPLNNTFTVRGRARCLREAAAEVGVDSGSESAASHACRLNNRSVRILQRGREGVSKVEE